MVDTYGNWTEEKDYINFPKENLCYFDIMAIWIREQKYAPETSMENLITKMFLHFDSELEDEDSPYKPNDDIFESYTDECKIYIEESGGISEFDYE